LQNSSPEWHAPELSWAHLGSFFGWGVGQFADFADTAEAWSLSLWHPIFGSQCLLGCLGRVGAKMPGCLFWAGDRLGGDCMDYVTIEIFCRLIPTSK
jgi:hypothetical protein